MDSWTLDLEQGTATLDEPPAGLEYLGSLAVEPMLGCFGVAPAARPGDLDRDLRPRTAATWTTAASAQGVTVYFPVFVEGALFHLGDGHAMQGDGEIVGTGIEISFDVEFTVDVLEGQGRSAGRAARTTSTSSPPATPARSTRRVQHATTELMRWLAADYGLDHRARSVLLGQ